MHHWCYWRQHHGLWSWQRKYFVSLIRWLCWKSKIMWQPLPSSKEPLKTQLLFAQLLFACIYALAIASHCWEVSDLLSNVWMLLSCWRTWSRGLNPITLFSGLSLSSFSEFVAWHTSQPFYAQSHKATCPESPRPRRNHLCCCFLSYPSGIPFCWLALPFSCITHRLNTYLLLQLFEG